MGRIYQRVRSEFAQDVNTMCSLLRSVHAHYLSDTCGRNLLQRMCTRGIHAVIVQPTSFAGRGRVLRMLHLCTVDVGKMRLLSSFSVPDLTLRNALTFVAPATDSTAFLAYHCACHIQPNPSAPPRMPSRCRRRRPSHRGALSPLAPRRRSLSQTSFMRWSGGKLSRSLMPFAISDDHRI